MEIAILSDSHDNLSLLIQSIDFIVKRDIQTLIHCGDITRPQTLDEISQRFPGKVFVSAGNADIDRTSFIQLSQERENLSFFHSVGEVFLDNFSVGFCHFPKRAKELCKTKKYHVVFYGHTHRPWEEYIEGIPLINPGTVGGVFQRATFAIYHTQKRAAELIALQGRGFVSMHTPRENT